MIDQSDSSDSQIWGAIVGVGHIANAMDADVGWNTPSEKLVALIMAFHADRKGIVRLSQSEIADSAILSRQRVATLIEDLCEMELFVRLGHGRYGLRYGKNQTDVPRRKDADAELQRLMAIRTDGQGIRYTSEGWPVLVDREE